MTLSEVERSGTMARPVRRGVLVPAVTLGTLLAVILAGPFLAGDVTGSVGTAFAAPDAAHLLGTDELGRDVARRMLAGGAPVLAVPLAAVTLSTALGVGIGLALAASSGRGRALVQLLDAVLVLPPLLVLIVFAFVLGPGVGVLLVVTTALNAPFTARHVRALADPLLDSGFVQAAVAGGSGAAAVMLRELLPNLRGPILADAGNRMVGAIYLISSAGFLGVGLSPSTVNWAAMVSEGFNGILLNPAASVAPAVGIGLLAISVNLLADRWSAR